jgi:flavodoxin
MKILIVYYSFSKNNELLAKEIQRRTGADLFKIMDKRKRNGFTIFLDIVFQRTPEIQSFYHSMNYYDYYILIAPVWAGRIASPLKSFILSEHKNMRGYSLISLCGGNGQREKLTTELTKLVGHAPDEVKELSVTDFLKNNNRKETVTGFQLGEQDITFFDTAIDDFLINQLGSTKNASFVTQR